MSSDTDGLPQAVAHSSDATADASHSLQIVPEKLAEHAIELGEAMVQFVAPAAPNEAAEAFGHRLEAENLSEQPAPPHLAIRGEHGPAVGKSV